jgi:hypothetical protein
MASNKIFECGRRAETVEFEMEPRSFQSLEYTERMRLKKERLPLSSTDSRANDPYSFVINLVQTPYEDDPFPPHAVLRPERRAGRGAVSRSLPKWVSRLSGVEASAPGPKRVVEDDEVEYFLPSSFSQSLSDPSYGGSALDGEVGDSGRKDSVRRRKRARS